MLIADPEITTFRPCGLVDDFVVIATDGLWDVMSSQDVVNFIRGKMDKAGLLGGGTGPPKPADALAVELARVADTLANHAVTDLRSQDNVTVMIVYLRNASGRAGRVGEDEGLEVHSSYWDVDDWGEGGVASPGPRQPRGVLGTFGGGGGGARAAGARAWNTKLFSKGCVCCVGCDTVR